MAKVSTLYSGFSGSGLPAEFSAYGSPVVAPTVSGGLLTMTSNAASGFSGVESTATFDWTNSEFIVKIGSVNVETIFGPKLTSGATTFPTLLFSTGSGNIRAGQSSTSNGSGSLASSTTGPWFKIAYSGSTFSWHESTDGENWSQFHSAPDSAFSGAALMTNIAVLLATAGSSTNTAIVDQVGLAPAAPAATAGFSRISAGLLR